ncbi:MAG TPA: hypothetical protein VIX82_14295, partial [Solirubrobacteraceae bacterium]
MAIVARPPSPAGSPQRRRRVPRPAVALAVIVAMMALAPIASARAPAQPAHAGVVMVRVSSSVISRPLPPGFVGLSLEYGYVTAYAGTDGGAINPVLLRLMRNLAPGQR